MTEIDGFQLTDVATAGDGSYSTSLLDETGTVVATVTRLPSGLAQASVVDDGSASDWATVLSNVTGFLENVATGARRASDEVTRISNAARGAVTGAQVGYNAPIDLKPWIIAGGVVVAAGLLWSAASSSGRR
jgi:hypothetical protein